MKLPFRNKSRVPRRRLNERDLLEDSAGREMFKRNRTLVGSTSSRLDSAGSNPDLRSPRKHIHILSIRRRKVVSTLAVVFLSIILIWTLISNFTATPVVGVGNLDIVKTIDKNRYERVVQDYLNINPTNRLSFFMDNAALNDYVIAKLPEVSSIAQKSMVNIGQTNFVVTLRQPVAGWKINAKQYFVDSSGIQFELNYFDSPKVQIVDSSGIYEKVVPSTAIASRRFLGFVGQVVSLSKVYGYTVTEAILPANMTRELVVKLAETVSQVKLSIDRPAGEQIEDMSNSIKYFASRGQAPEYIDVRVSGKAFYK